MNEFDNIINMANLLMSTANIITSINSVKSVFLSTNGTLHINVSEIPDDVEFETGDFDEFFIEKRYIKGNIEIFTLKFKEE